MIVDEDKTTSDIKVPRFDDSNKTILRDTRIKVYTQSFKCAAMVKYGTVGGALFQPLAITKAGATPPSLHFAPSRARPRLCCILLVQRKLPRLLRPS